MLSQHRGDSMIWMLMASYIGCYNRTIIIDQINSPNLGILFEWKENYEIVENFTIADYVFWHEFVLVLARIGWLDILLNDFSINQSIFIYSRSNTISDSLGTIKK